MAWPPPTLPTSRTNTTVMADTHPADHNAVNLAVNDLVVRMTTRENKITANSAAVVVSSASPTSLATIVSVTVAVGDYVLATGNCWATMVAGNTSSTMHLAFEASGGGITYAASSSPDTDQALLAGGSGQTLQTPMFISRVFGPMTAAGTFSCGTRGWTTAIAGGSSVSMASNRCQLTRL